MSIEHLDTNKMTAVIKGFAKAADLFKEERQSAERATTELLMSWEGKGRNTFETKYKVFSKQIEDMEDFLLDLYNSLIEAQITYMDTDDKLSKKMEG